MSALPAIPDELAQIKQLEKTAAEELEKTRTAGAARVKVIREMEQDKKDAMIKVKKQRVDLLKLLQLINRHDAAYKVAKEQIEKLKIQYASSQRMQVERQLETA